MENQTKDLANEDSCQLVRQIVLDGSIIKYLLFFVVSVRTAVMYKSNLLIA